MNIILEGVDASGKSTLAKELAARTGLPIIPSEGPEKYFGEINERVKRYNDFNRPAIYDRHPIVSHYIYSTVLRTLSDGIKPELIQEFMSRPHLIVYCRPTRAGFSVHNLRPDEDPDHVQQVADKYTGLVNMYDDWGLNHAHLIYNCGVNLDRTLSMITTLYMRYRNV
jgi:hypothetical protein